MPSGISLMREHWVIARNYDERMSSSIAASTSMPPYMRASGMKSGGKRGGGSAEPSIGFVTQTLFGMSGRIVPVFALDVVNE